MSTVSKIITLLILVALAGLVIKNPQGFASDATAVFNGGNRTLALESGQGLTTGTFSSPAYKVT